ncbi:MAG: iron(II)-dependent oxidoreductase [Candidatus Latescibacterota bacterium]|jgi:iron(II)-dependent oxidoreductase
MVTASELAVWVRDARQRTLDLVADLSDEQMMGPYLNIVNPYLWEIGHIAWFQENWVLRHAAKQAMIREDADALYDSIAIAHDTRWDLPLPNREETLTYMCEVRDRVLERLENDPSEEEIYHGIYTVYHEDMHTEAFTYTRQTHGYTPPSFSTPPEAAHKGGPVLGDVEIPGGTFQLGAAQNDPFVFDNEKWAHPVNLAPFAIARAPVTQNEYAAFVDDGGYGRQEFWSQEGWQWREVEKAEHPIYWRSQNNGTWLRRHFDCWNVLESHLPVIHINGYEAEAYCRWAGRRLPNEAEWEAAATAGGENLGVEKRRYPWGNDPTSERLHFDWRGLGCAEVGAYPEGDSAFGCRQMLGNVWEWTSSVFRPFPGFEPDLYKEYSEPWFETRKVLRGGAWATRSRLVWNTSRNFFTPERRDVFAGFRTCALKI